MRNCRSSIKRHGYPSRLPSTPLLGERAGGGWDHLHNGASVKTVQMALGHATPTMTLNTYVGEWPEPHEKTRSIVDGALGRVPRMCPETGGRKRNPR